MIAAPFTAFNEDGSVNLAKVSEQKKFYKDSGVAGAFICGSTGEGAALTTAERKALFKEWGKFQDPDFTVIAFLGGTSLEEERELAVWAKECGLDAVAITAPYYQKPANVADLCACCAHVASAVPDMPFFYYHIPVLSGVNFPMYSLLKLMDEAIPNLAGIKYTFEDMMDYLFCLQYKNKKYNILWGRDEQYLEALAIGAEGSVGSTFGYMAPVYTALEEAYKAGKMDEAVKIQLEANEMISLLNKYGSGCGKAYMKAAGCDLGPCRLPLKTFSDETWKAFLEDLKATSFEKYKNSYK